MKTPPYDRITTTIEREWLAQIIAGTKKIEYPPNQAVLDKALREGLSAIRTAPAQRHESPGARGHGADPPDREGSTCGRVPTAHQEGIGVQALGQREREA